MSKAARVLAGVIAVVGLSALALQFELLAMQRAAHGLSRIGVMIWFSTYFSIQTNFLAAVVTGAAALGLKGFPARDTVRAAVAVYLVIVGVVFFLLLRNTVPSEGLQGVANVLLHYVTPPLYVLFWLLATSKNKLRWRDPAIWLIYPFVYLAAVLLLARKSGFYPYPFLDLHALGAARLTVNVALLAAAFLGVGLVAVAIGHVNAKHDR